MGIGRADTEGRVKEDAEPQGELTKFSNRTSWQKPAAGGTLTGQGYRGRHDVDLLEHADLRRRLLPVDLLTLSGLFKLGIDADLPLYR